VFAAGRAAIALHEWMQATNITSGPIFREVYKDGSIGAKSLPLQSVNLILKKRCRMAGLDPAALTDCDLASWLRPDAMESRLCMLCINQHTGQSNRPPAITTSRCTLRAGQSKSTFRGDSACSRPL
jgi:hypothetical protein